MRNAALSRLAVVAGLAAWLALGGGVSARALGGEAPGSDETTSSKANAEDETPAWDQIATIRGAAERLGRLHRALGAKAAYDLIDACYRTHSLSSNYGEGYEICIVQDYLETRTLMKVYARMPPEMLEKLGVPSPQDLARGMTERIAHGFGRYGKSQAYADNLKKLVDQHGVPVFLALVFPEAADSIKLQEKSKSK